MLNKALLTILLIGLKGVYPILLKDWGTDSHINRLAYATYDVFSEAFQQITASLEGLYPVPDLIKTFSQVMILCNFIYFLTSNYLRMPPSQHLMLRVI